MDNKKSKEMLSAGLMGVSGFVGLFSLFCIIYYFTDSLNKPIYPIKYLIPTFIISLTVWFYCFQLNRSLRKFHETK